MLNLAPVNKYFKKERNVLFVLLFGSSAKGTRTPLSDIDIAVYLADYVKISRFFDLKLKFMTECPLKGEKDVIILNECTPLLAYEAAAHGKPIFTRDKKAYINFKAKSFLRFFDTQMLRSTQYAAMQKRIKGGKFGHLKGSNSIKVSKIREFSRKITRARAA